MRTLGVRPSTLACAAVLVAYWIPLIVAARWSMWSGEGSLELLRTLGEDYVAALGSQVFADHGLLVIGLALGGSAVAMWGSIRAWRAGSLGDDVWLVAGAMFGVTYLLTTLWPLALDLVFGVGCRFSTCWMF